MTVLGSFIRLDSRRVVFVGASDKPEYDGHRYLAFKDSQGNDTTLALSPEATDALRQLLNADVGTEEFPFTVILHWQPIQTESVVRTEIGGAR